MARGRGIESRWSAAGWRTGVVRRWWCGMRRLGSGRGMAARERHVTRIEVHRWPQKGECSVLREAPRRPAQRPVGRVARQELRCGPVDTAGRPWSGRPVGIGGGEIRQRRAKGRTGILPASSPVGWMSLTTVKRGNPGSSRAPGRGRPSCPARCGRGRRDVGSGGGGGA